MSVTIKIRQSLSVISATLVIGATTLAPAFAMGEKRDDGDEPGAGIGISHSIVLFFLVPLAISGVIALAVLAPGWTSSARKATKNGFLDDPNSDQLSSGPERAKLTYE